MNKIFLKSGAIVLIGTLLYKLAFLAKDIILTSKLGISTELSLFISAFLIPSFLCNTLAQSLQVTSSNYIVHHHNSLSKSFLFSVFKKVFLISLFTYILLILLLPTLFASYNKEQVYYMRTLSLTSIPFFLTMPLRGILGQNLYLNKYYLLNFSLAMISAFALIIYSVISPDPNAVGLMISLSLGSLIELCAVYFANIKVKVINKKAGSEIKFREIFSGLLLQFLLMTPPLIDQMFAQFKGPEYLTIYNYAIKVPNIITTLSMIIASSVLLPFFIENKGKSFYSKISNNKLLFITLVLLCFYLLSPSISDLIVNIIYQRGKFTLSDAINVSHIQRIYFYSSPLTAIFMIYIRYLNAHEMHFYATKLSGTIVILNFIFCVIWFKINRLDLIPYSIIGSYFLTFILFKFRNLK